MQINEITPGAKAPKGLCELLFFIHALKGVAKSALQLMSNFKAR